MGLLEYPVDWRTDSSGRLHCEVAADSLLDEKALYWGEVILVQRMQFHIPIFCYFSGIEVPHAVPWLQFLVLLDVSAVFFFLIFLLIASPFSLLTRPFRGDQLTSQIV